MERDDIPSGPDFLLISGVDHWAIEVMNASDGSVTLDVDLIVDGAPENDPTMAFGSTATELVHSLWGIGIKKPMAEQFVSEHWHTLEQNALRFARDYWRSMNLGRKERPELPWVGRLDS